MGPGEFSAHPTMETGVPWDEFTTISDPQMLATMAANKSQMMNLSPNVWTTGSVPTGLSPSSPMSAQAQPMSAPTYAMQPDGTVWQVPPPPQQPSRAMSYPGQDLSPTYQNQQQFQQQMPPDLKRRMTTPAQSLSAPSAGPHSSPGSASDMQPPVPYPAPPGMEYAQWPMNPMPQGMGIVPYPMYAGDAIQQQQPFSTNPSPMGHPGGPGRSGP
ncbi:transcriptional regulator family: Fungal Specific TF [Penicillium verhagenii]|uniref:transcriptional regulator family: Fungal Specific TF n=1 Tax=Penicillium verhagenii TaxID=1562060 RepID=UPI002545B257|nr:transcriptional regulator family: Fungal Specific TF [Penicillium verhagenii]KAJ5919309.1 transcriptional regulator family: Fungal Specific TF [Penicillium verhagenii]